MNTNHPRQPLSIVVLISGGGTTLKNLLEKISHGQLEVRIELVISSNPTARGLAIAVEAGIPTQVVDRQGFASDELYSAAIFDACRATGAPWVIMGGFLT